MRIAITAGHNVYINKYFDPGAVNPPITEADKVKETVFLLIPLLVRQGHIVLDCTPYGETFKDTRSSHVERCRRVDEFGADIYIDIHLNAGGGTGVEVWVHNMDSKSVPYAIKICDNISRDMNLPNRGVKAKPSFWSVSLTTKPALIVEGAFIDNKTDMEKLTPLKYATAIAKAFGEIKVDLPIVSEGKLYRVQVGAYSVKENAEKLLNDLKKAGFNGYIKEEDIEIPVIPTKSDYIEYETDKLSIMEVIPDLCYTAFANGKNLKQLDVVGVNGTWQNNQEAHLPIAIWGLCANKNGAIGPNSHQNSPQGHKRGTIVYYEDGELDIVRVNNINEFKKPIMWAIGGGSLIPTMVSEENFASDIFRNTYHTAVAIKDGRVYQIVSKVYCTMSEFREFVKKLGLEKAIFLDGGASSQMNTRDGKGLYSSRGLASGLFIKGGK